MRAFLLALALLIPLASQSLADPIHACAAKSNGKLRVVANAGMCKASETALSWEQSPSPVAPFKFVGFTSATVGSAGPFQAGILEWTRACGAEFTGSRVCKTEEVIFSIDPPQIVGPEDFAWVMMTVVAPNTDISGATALGQSCGLLGAGTGLVIDGHGRYNTANCTDAHRVACCAP